MQILSRLPFPRTLAFMVAILELPFVRRMVPALSVELYEQMGERINGRRTELIRGIIVEKMSSSPLHSFLITRLQRLVLMLIGTDSHCRQEQPLKMVDSMPEPDLAVVAGRNDHYRHTHPTTALLIIEVAVTSVELDREKAALYAEAGVAEYWIVLADDAAIEVHTDPQKGLYTQRRVYSRAETLLSVALPALRVDLAALFASE